MSTSFRKKTRATNYRTYGSVVRYGPGNQLPAQGVKERTHEILSVRGILKSSSIETSHCIVCSAQSLASGWGGYYSFRCQPVDYSNSPMAMRMARGCWWYYFSKFTEFFDTIFFVLRKKNNQVSRLHVIHHGVMPISVWFGVKFSPGKYTLYSVFTKYYDPSIIRESTCAIERSTRYCTI